MNEFEKWAKETYGDNVIDNTPRYQSLPYLTDLKMAYKAGAAAGYANGVAVMKERCADIPERMAACMFDSGGKMIVSGISTAIRGLK